MNGLVFVFTIILISLCLFLWQQIKQQTKAKPKLDRSLDKQLLVMMGGDKKAVLRLLRHARKKHPGKSYLWYHEKVIADLQRDRRY